MIFRAFFFCLFLLVHCAAVAQNGRYEIRSGSIAFRSDAPLELIEAKSTELRGLIEPESGKFAFSVAIRTFQGFNNPVQKEHFNENYMESNDFPSATFAGKIIEDVDFSKNGIYSVRAKGKLKIHGVEQERIIKSEIIVKDGKLSVNAVFSVLLNEHKINIPKIVYQKIAEEIQITVAADFEPASQK